MTAQPNIPGANRNPGDEMLTLQEACLFLREPEGTLRYWRHLGSGPRSFKVGRHVRYRRTDLTVWLTEQTQRDGARGEERTSYPQPSRLLDGKVGSRRDDELWPASRIAFEERTRASGSRKPSPWN